MTILDVFCLTNPDGSALPPSVQATILAKYSRSPESARKLVAEISSEEADKFHDKWTISYGHSSVAEMAALPICLEGVSIVASKFIEKWPRAGYSEKSTRYQEFSEDSFVTPPGAPSTMKTHAAKYFAAYKSLYPKLFRRCAAAMGMDPDDPKTASSAKVKARTFDNLRYLLPAGTGTNVAMFMNLRDMRYFVSAARAHTNREIREIGEAVYEAGSGACPTLLKDAFPDSFEPRVMTISHEAPQEVVLKYADGGLSRVKEFVATKYGMTWATFSKHMESRGQRQVPDAFKEARIQFDLTMDYGAYRDLQRHRRCDQYAEPLTPYLGYAVPDDIAGTDLEQEYRTAMELVELYDDGRVVNDVDLMQYMVPLGYLHRSTFSMDLKELYYIVELRTRPQGHISYRRVAYEMYEKASAAFPELMKWCVAVKPDAIGEHLLGVRLRVHGVYLIPDLLAIVQDGVREDFLRKERHGPVLVRDRDLGNRQARTVDCGTGSRLRRHRR